MLILYSANRESLTFALDPRDRARYPKGSLRVMVAFATSDWPTRLELLNEADRQAIAHILTGGAETLADFEAAG